MTAHIPSTGANLDSLYGDQEIEITDTTSIWAKVVIDYKGPPGIEKVEPAQTPYIEYLRLYPTLQKVNEEDFRKYLKGKHFVLGP